MFITIITIVITIIIIIITIIIITIIIVITIVIIRLWAEARPRRAPVPSYYESAIDNSY